MLNALRAQGRYSGSYELIAKRVGQFVSGAQQAQAFEHLFALVALSCAVGNGALTAFGRSACGLSAARVKQVLERVEQGVRATQRDMRHYAKEHLDFAPAAERLSAAWERALERSIRG